MNITILDKSLYLRGLLLLVSKDKVITESEKMYVMEAGKSLGFEKKFCENAVGEILENEFISDIPPKFSSREIAEYFINDGLTIALSDFDLHAEELDWLATAVFCFRVTISPNVMNSSVRHMETRRPSWIVLFGHPSQRSCLPEGRTSWGCRIKILWTDTFLNNYRGFFTNTRRNDK